MHQLTPNYHPRTSLAFSASSLIIVNESTSFFDTGNFLELGLLCLSYNSTYFSYNVH
jgi:hypothetical protein